MNKQILMIHEFKEDFLKLPLENYILTFDDGLYTQYKFLEELKKIKTEKYFFISSGIICSENLKQNDEFTQCDVAHLKALSGDYTNYMKWSQIKEISKLNNFFIGCHSHLHNIKTADCIESIKLDNKHMLENFEKNIGYVPNHFCFPYNKKTTIYETILRKNGFKYFYGKEKGIRYNTDLKINERLDIYEL